ncbi:MAG: oligoendopeptidase F [Planctomycetota bacterium]
MDSRSAARIRPRAEIPDRDRWKIQDIYTSIEEWEKDFTEIKESIPKLAEYKGRLSESGKTLLEFFTGREGVSQIFSRAYSYAFMKRDEDTRVQDHVARLGRIANLATEFSQSLSFVNPEILALPEETLQNFIREEAGLNEYAHYLDDLLRTKKFTLSDKEERILAASGNIARSMSDIFTALTNTDLTFPKIKDEDGNEVATSHSLYYKYRGAKDRAVRKANEEAFHGTFRKFRNSLAAMMQANVNRDRFYTSMRGYSSCLERALHDDNIPEQVYHNLIKTVNLNLAPLHRYTRLRKRILGLDRLCGYDLYCSLFPEQDLDINYDEAVTLVRKGLAPLGEEYMGILNTGLENGWVDVYENEGKRSGAYSTGVYGVHPYVLHNYNGTLNDVFTLAHEMGHALHSYYSQTHQPYHYSGYPIFAAEIASTANEALLMLHVLKETREREKKLYLLDFFLDQIRATFYRQTLFSEFELAVHEKAESGESLTADLMDTIYGDLFKKYYGPELDVDEFKTVEWSRIPHFYRNFYVYTYATGISAGTAFAHKILKEGDTARDKYIHTFLSGGSSEYVIDLLKKADLDMTTPTPILATISFFDELLDELEALL